MPLVYHNPNEVNLKQRAVPPLPLVLVLVGLGVVAAFLPLVGEALEGGDEDVVAGDDRGGGEIARPVVVKVREITRRVGPLTSRLIVNFMLNLRRGAKRRVAWEVVTSTLENGRGVLVAVSVTYVGNSRLCPYSTPKK